MNSHLALAAGLPPVVLSKKGLFQKVAPLAAAAPEREACEGTPPSK